MKLLLLLGSAICVTLFSACNTGTGENSANTAENAPLTAPVQSPAGVQNNSPIKGIVENYLQLKNALASDNTTEAATAATEMLTDYPATDTAALNADQRKLLASLRSDIYEHAEHIRDNAGKIDHQREHFEMLSKDVEDLVRSVGGGQTLYKDFCPMANDGKGAYWLSEAEPISNPYYGSSMLKCGQVKETLSQ